MGDYTVIADVRALGRLSDDTLYPDATLTDAITVSELLIDRVCGTSFVYKAFTNAKGWGENARRCRLTVDDGRPLLFGRTITSATIDGTAVADTSGWSFDRAGAVWHEEGEVFVAPTFEGPPNVVVNGTAGYSSTCPDDIARAAALYAQALVLEDASRMEARALTITNELGQVRLSTPGAMYPTGIPAVDAVLNRRRQLGPMVG